MDTGVIKTKAEREGLIEAKLHVAKICGNVTCREPGHFTIETRFLYKTREGCRGRQSCRCKNAVACLTAHYHEGDALDYFRGQIQYDAHNCPLKCGFSSPFEYNSNNNPKGTTPHTHLGPRIRPTNCRLNFLIVITVGEYVIEHLTTAHNLPMTGIEGSSSTIETL